MNTYQTNERRQKQGFLDLVWEYKFHFAAYIVVISTITFVGLYLAGGVPDELKLVDNSSPVASAQASTDTDQGLAAVTPDTSIAPVQTQTTSNGSANVAGNTTAVSTNQEGELPEHIYIDKIGVNAIINNPTTTNNDTLDNYLLKGAVRYPGSGTLGHGNMFIFGHSTGIKIVNNQAFKTFNNLKNLNIGDTIRVDSGDREYTYSVISVVLSDSDKQWVDLTSTDNMLTLSTCDVFGQKQQRFVVQATYTGSHSL